MAIGHHLGKVVNLLIVDNRMSVIAVLQGFQIVKKEAAGNCKLTPALSCWDNSSFVGCWRSIQPSPKGNGFFFLENFENHLGTLKFIPVHFLHP